MEKEIGKAGIAGDYVFSDGSLLEWGNGGGGVFVVKEGGAEEEVQCGIGNIATVWYGEVVGMAEVLARTQQGRNILILADLKAAIVTVRKAGRTGKARSNHLKKVVDEIGREL